MSLEQKKAEYYKLLEKDPAKEYTLFPKKEQKVKAVSEQRKSEYNNLVIGAPKMEKKTGSSDDFIQGYSSYVDSVTGWNKDPVDAMFGFVPGFKGAYDLTTKGGALDYMNSFIFLVLFFVVFVWGRKRLSGKKLKTKDMKQKVYLIMACVFSVLSVGAVIWLW